MERDRATGELARGDAKIIALMPTRGHVAAETMMAMVVNTEGYQLELLMENRLPVDVARNRLASRALERAGDSDPFVCWIDSDAFFLEGTLTTLIVALMKNEIDLLAPMAGARVAGSSIQALKNASDPGSWLRLGADYRAGEIVRVELVSSHFMLHRASLLARLGPQPFGSSSEDETEDFHFCRRVRDAGGVIAVHTGVPAFHVDERNGAAYLPGFDPVRIVGNTIDPHAKIESLDREVRSYGPRIDRLL